MTIEQVKFDAFTAELELRKHELTTAMFMERYSEPIAALDEAAQAFAAQVQAELKVLPVRNELALFAAALGIFERTDDPVLIQVGLYELAAHYQAQVGETVLV